MKKTSYMSLWSVCISSLILLKPVQGVMHRNQQTDMYIILALPSPPPYRHLLLAQKAKAPSPHFIYTLSIYSQVPQVGEYKFTMTNLRWIYDGLHTADSLLLFTLIFHFFYKKQSLLFFPRTWGVSKTEKVAKELLQNSKTSPTSQTKCWDIKVQLRLTVF